MGEQQVFWMAVVFSHEKNEGWSRHVLMLGKVFGTCNRPAKDCADAGTARAATTRPASALSLDIARRWIGAVTWMSCVRHAAVIYCA